jgi:sugar/nucleoside kinase (ribokinase family)/phosphoglycolate phosphatase-like HAD superfamily hydrolase
LALKATQVKRLLERIPELRIGIVGDFCADLYLTIDPTASEISLETGLTTQPVAEQRFSPGGAGSVAANLRSMGVGEVVAFGVVGGDMHGSQLIRLLEGRGISTSCLLVQNEKWQTHVFTKILVDGVEQPRLDYGNFNELNPELAERLLQDLEQRLSRLDVLIINQQVYRGIHIPAFRKALTALIVKNRQTLYITDSRAYSGEFEGSARKLNEHEALAICGKPRPPGEYIPGEIAREAAAELFRRWREPVFLSRGVNGCIVCDREALQEIPGLMILNRIDPVGAGDSMLAGIAAALPAGLSPVLAAEFGTLVAGVTVQKLFETGTATPEEILEISAAPVFRYRPDLARRPEKACYHESSKIEIVTNLPEGKNFTHFIFDHDGTISTLRQGWEQDMAPMMVDAIVGDKRGDVAGQSLERIRNRVRQLIEETTGVQTLVQMQYLSELVREYGYVAEEDVLDAAGYKQIYNAALMRRIRVRLARVQQDRRSADEFIIPNAVDFLAAVHSRGAHLYLASGTDQEDVEREAAVLGYAELFSGRIYGAVGDLRHEPKLKALETIMREIEKTGRGRMVMFGDGPVEIRETRNRGGFAVGVASEEVQRRGLNVVKRSRLIQAGADLIVPDFSEADRLIALFFQE